MPALDICYTSMCKFIYEEPFTEDLFVDANRDKSMIYFRAIEDWENEDGVFYVVEMVLEGQNQTWDLHEADSLDLAALFIDAYILTKKETYPDIIFVSEEKLDIEKYQLHGVTVTN